MHIHYYFDNPTKAQLSGKESAIYVWVYSAEGRVKVHTGIRIESRYWDFPRQCAKKSYPGVVALNFFLSELKTRILSTLRQTAAHNGLTVEYIKKEVRKLISGHPVEANDLLERFKEYTAAKQVTLSHNSTRKHITARNHLIDYSERFNTKITFESINYSFFEKFVAFLMQEKKHLNNTVLKQIVILKGFLNWSVDMGYTTNENHRKFKLKEQETAVIHLSEEELLALYHLDLSDSGSLGRIRDIFCFQAFTGQRYSDVRDLDWDGIDFKNRWWSLTSQKTRDKLQIPLNDFALAILMKYGEQRKLPSVSNQKLNKYLKVLGERAEIKAPFSIVQFRGSNRIDTKGPKYEFLTSHVARKTFVTLSLAKGMRQETVASITGHRDFKTMKKYLKITNDMKVSEMNKIWSFSSDK